MTILLEILSTVRGKPFVINHRACVARVMLVRCVSRLFARASEDKKHNARRDDRRRRVVREKQERSPHRRGGGGGRNGKEGVNSISEAEEDAEKAAAEAQGRLVQ